MTPPTTPQPLGDLAGLSEAEAAARLRSEGPNELPGRDRRSLPAIVMGVLREPMFALLIGGGLIYVALGDLREALLLLAFANLSIAITVIQEFRSERVLAALRDLASPTSTVIREGRRRSIASRLLVPGDIVALAEGERVAADGLLRTGDEVEVDESLLTGESVPVAKQPAAGEVAAAAPGGEGGPRLFSGTLVVRGQGLAELTATGRKSELGKLGRSLETVAEPSGALTKETRRIVRAVGSAAIVLCGAVVLLVALFHGGWLQGLLAGVALGMAMLPEEFPLVLTVFTVMGAWRLSRAKVLTKRAAAIETLGSATVLCTDKTGTLTQNRMRLAVAWRDGSLVEWPADRSPPPEARPLIDAGVLASAPHPFDPMERAFHEAAALASAPPIRMSLARTHGVTPEILAVSQVWTQGNGEARIAASKGAPEAILRLCKAAPDQVAEVMAAVERLAERGMRVLAVAQGPVEADWRPDAGRPLRLLGLVGLADPLRADVAASVEECHTAGVRVVMVTGDYPATAAAIARQAGIDAGTVITGAELAAMSDAELALEAPRVGVFARIMPEQKLRIVRALQAAGEVVAMTGDGVNDAPALRAADIGIAMGARGTDVARAAADLVLLDDDFASIVRGMRLGRRIYDNLRKAMGFVLAVHIPIAGLALLPLLLGLPMFLAPTHIAFLEMIIDPVCSVVFEVEREERDVMRRPPRRPGAPLFTRAAILARVLQGVVVLVATMAMFGVAAAFGLSESRTHAVVFVALVASVLALVLANRSLGSLLGALRRPNPAFLAVLVAVIGMLAAALGLPQVRSLFRFGVVGPAELALALAGGVGALVGLELSNRAFGLARGD